MTRTHDDDFQQFRGAFDDAMMPDADFRAKIEKLLESEQSQESTHGSTVLASPPRQQPQTVVPPARRSGPLMVAVAALAVLSVAIASVWVLSGDMLEGEYANAPGAVATIPADAPGMPQADVQLTAKETPNWHENDVLLGVYDNVLLSQRWSGDDQGSDFVYPSYMTARDAVSGETLWEHILEDYWIIGVHDGHIIAVQNEWSPSDQHEITDQYLAVFDFETGELETSWSIGYDPQSLRAGTYIPVIAGDHIVLATNNGVAKGWSIETGDLIWETEFDAGQGWLTETSFDDNSTRAVVVTYVAAARWQDQVVVVNGDGTVFVLESSTGDVVAQHAASPAFRHTSRIMNLEAYSLDSGILVVRDIAQGGINQEAIAVDPETGDTLWRRSLEGQARFSTSGDGTLAFNDHLWIQHPWFLQPFGLLGYSTFEFHWIDGESGEVILETERGKLEAPAVTLTNGEYACTRTERTEIVCFNRAGTRYIIEIEPWGDPVMVDGVLYIPTDDGLYRVELP